ncbi:MAG: hypothetical protein PVH61_37390 [Candidatus Aminicenantes bacterium]|jgi:hypothetical protein
MKKQLKKKLDLGKATVQHLEMNRLDRNDQKEIKGGDDNSDAIATLTPVFCKP